MKMKQSETIVKQILKKWKYCYDKNWLLEIDDENFTTPINSVNELNSILDKELYIFFKSDPDPNDERHPYHTRKNSEYAEILNLLCKEVTFYNSLKTNYFLENENDMDLLYATCRLMYMMSPAFELEQITTDEKSESVVKKLFALVNAELNDMSFIAIALLSLYATNSDKFSNFHDEFTKLVETAINELKRLQAETNKENKDGEPPFKKLKIDFKRPFGIFSTSTKKDTPGSSPKQSCISDENQSNSSCFDHKFIMLPEFTLKSPIDFSIRHILLLKFLAPISEYQDILGILIEKNLLYLMFDNITKSNNIAIVLESLKVVACLLCHKKIATFFTDYTSDGLLQKLLDVPVSSVAATMVPCCLYSLSSFTDILRSLCSNRSMLKNILLYILTALEKLHMSAKVFSAMFLQNAFPFRPLLDEFDNENGLRWLLNFLNVLVDYHMKQDDERVDDSEKENDYLDMHRQATEHVLHSLKKYLQSHLAIRVNQLERQKSRNDRNLEQIPDLPFNKPIELSSEAIEEQISFLKSELGTKARWAPLSELESSGAVDGLSKLLIVAFEWRDYPHVNEVMICLMDVLAICSTVCKCQTTILNELDGVRDVKNCFSVIFHILENEESIFELRKSALTLIKSCLTVPANKISNSNSYMRFNSKRHSVTPKRIKTKHQIDQTLLKIWKLIRDNGGILCLIELLSNLNNNDSSSIILKTLTLKCFIGLARCPSIKQILTKLPIFKEGLKQVISIPLEDTPLFKKLEESAKYLLAVLEDPNKKNSKSVHVRFDDNELMPLIERFLIEKGYTKTINTLKIEDKEKRPPAVEKLHGLCKDSDDETMNSSNFSCSTPGPKQKKLLKFKQEKLFSPKIYESPIIFNDTSYNHETDVTRLQDVVMDYLEKQHSKCKQPISTCPPFNFSRPHSCPIGTRHILNTQPNICIRMNEREKLCTMPCFKKNLRRYERHWKWNRLKYFYDFILSEHDGVINQEDVFSACSFIYNSAQLCLGTQGGSIKSYNRNNLEKEIWHVDAVSSAVAKINQNPRKERLFSVSSFSYAGDSETAVFCQSSETPPKRVHFINETESFEWSQLGDKAVINIFDSCYVYDVSRWERCLKLPTVDTLSWQVLSPPSFSYDDKLIVMNNSLVCSRSGKYVHKFDQLSKTANGIFNPNGIEVILNSEIWDIRNYELVKVVPELDNLQLKFNSLGDVMFSLSVNDAEKDDDEDDPKRASTLKVFDARNYDRISNLDLQSHCDDFAIDDSDTLASFVVSRNGIIERHNDLIKEVKVGEIGGVSIKDDAAEDTEDQNSADSDGLENEWNDFSSEDLLDELSSENSEWEDLPEGLENSISNDDDEEEEHEDDNDDDDDDDDNVLYAISDNSNLL